MTVSEASNRPLRHSCTLHTRVAHERIRAARRALIQQKRLSETLNSERTRAAARALPSRMHCLQYRHSCWCADAMPWTSMTAGVYTCEMTRMYCLQHSPHIGQFVPYADGYVRDK